GRHSEFVEAIEDQFRYAVVEYALALDDSLLLRVESRGVVLEVHDEGAGLGTLVEDLGLAFVDACAPGVHSQNPHPKSFCSFARSRPRRLLTPPKVGKWRFGQVRHGGHDNVG